MNRMTRLVLIAGAIVGAWAAGCAPYATHPRLEGSMQVTGPRVYPVPELMAQAIRFAHDHYCRGQEYVINLPWDMTPEVYRDVIGILGSGRPMREPGEAAFHVQAVRVRGVEAEVDLIYPQSGGHHEMVTIYMKRGIIARYDVQDTRLWRVRISPPEPRYRPVELAAQP
jgi:hypothetical protein